MTPSQDNTIKPKEQLSFGLALSGGGSRAIAFHLGCLRALDSIGLLNQCRVISAVSGGSVIGAMYAQHEGSFDEFDRDVRIVLRRGFLVPAITTSITTIEGIKAAFSFILAVTTTLIIQIFRLSLAVMRLCVNHKPANQMWYWTEASRSRRFASRTTIVEKTFDRVLFDGRCMASLSARSFAFVAVAAELRTGSAFYFTPDYCGSWRVGRVNAARVSIAKAVAASAAHPFMLPALDEVFLFEKQDGSRRAERVTLADGGVYDNLGLAPLWPDRDASVGVPVPRVNAIIACRAGYGLSFRPPAIFWFGRMASAFFTVLDRAQNAALKRLFDLRAAGSLNAIILPYLGQDDTRLKYAPYDLIRRDQVADYPANFSAMSEEWIEKIVRRGEQTTIAVIKEHHPGLIT